MGLTEYWEMMNDRTMLIVALLVLILLTNIILIVVNWSNKK